MGVDIGELIGEEKGETESSFVVLGLLEVANTDGGLGGTEVLLGIALGGLLSVRASAGFVGAEVLGSASVGKTKGDLARFMVCGRAAISVGCEP